MSPAERVYPSTTKSTETFVLIGTGYVVLVTPDVEIASTFPTGFIPEETKSIYDLGITALSSLE